jgi:capsular polysaccharide biosynthesis protein
VPHQTHYHWLIETLPRIISASQFEPKSKLISSSRTTAYQRKALEELGLNVLYSDARHHSNNLILATRGEDTGWAHPQDLDILRKTYKVPSTKGFRRILVSRVGSRRSDHLSQAIQDYAEKTGWTIVQSENLTWDEALSIYGEASVIAGEHGAGLANVALAPLGTQLIELQRHSYPNPCYAALSQSLNGNTSCYSLFQIDEYKRALIL